MAFISLVSYAQDRVPVDPIEQDKDRVESLPDDSRNSSPASSVVDSAYARPGIADGNPTRTVEKAPTKKNEEDVLSFHFLYYIIQKFKMSDIVDK